MRTNKWLAEQLGKDPATVSKWCTNSSQPGIELLFKIAEVLKVDATAWCEQKGVRECIEKKFPSIKVYYREEEPGCDVYYTNDDTGDYFPERYFLDCYEEPQYWRTKEEAAKWVEELVGYSVETTFTAILDALDQYVEKQENPDDYFTVFTSSRLLTSKREVC